MIMSLVWKQESKSDKLFMLKIEPDHNPLCFVNSLLKGRNILSVFTTLGAVEAKTMDLLSGGVEPDLYLMSLWISSPSARAPEKNIKLYFVAG